jgi:hypothetical protein
VDGESRGGGGIFFFFDDVFEVDGLGDSESDESSDVCSFFFLVFFVFCSCPIL